MALVRVAMAQAPVAMAQALADPVATAQAPVEMALADPVAMAQEPVDPVGLEALVRAVTLTALPAIPLMDPRVAQKATQKANLAPTGLSRLLSSILRVTAGLMTVSRLPRFRSTMLMVPILSVGIAGFHLC